MNRIKRLWELHCEIAQASRMMARITSHRSMCHLCERRIKAIKEYNTLKFWFLLSK